MTVDEAHNLENAGLQGHIRLLEVNLRERDAQLATLTTAHQQAVKERDAARGQYAACHKLHIEAMEECEEKNIMMLTLRAVGAEQELIAVKASHQQAVEALAGVRTERDRLRDVKWSGITDLENRVIALEATLKLCIEAWEHEGEPSAIGYELAVARANAALHGTGGQL